MIFPAHFRTTTNARKGWIGVITLSHEHRSVWKHFQRKRHEVKWWQWPRHCHPFGHLIAIHFPPFIVNEQRMTPVVKVRFAVQLALNFHFKRIFYNPVIICECYNMAQWVQTPEESSIYGLFFLRKMWFAVLKDQNRGVVWFIMYSINEHVCKILEWGVYISKFNCQIIFFKGIRH